MATTHATSMTRREWVERAERRLDEWDAAVGRLEARTAEAGGRVGSELHGQLRAAKESLRKAHASYSRAKDAANEAWETVNEEIGTAWDANREALERSVNAVRSALP